MSNQTPYIAKRDGVLADGVQVAPEELDHIDPNAQPTSGLGVIDRRPVLVAFIAALLPALTTAVTAFANGEEAKGVVATLVVALLAALGKVVESRVTPLADPRDDAGSSLQPVPETPTTRSSP